MCYKMAKNRKPEVDNPVPQLRHSRRHGRGLWSPVRKIAGEVRPPRPRTRTYGDPAGSSGLQRKRWN